jgi:hypothetical protein
MYELNFLWEHFLFFFVNCTKKLRFTCMYCLETREFVNIHPEKSEKSVLNQCR